MRHAHILDTGSYVPKRVVTNAEVEVGTRRDALNPGVRFFRMYGRGSVYDQPAPNTACNGFAPLRFANR